MAELEQKKFIDLDKVLREKNPSLYRLLPKFLIKLIKQIIHQEDLNNDLWELRNKSGVAKFDTFLKMKNVKLNLIGKNNIPESGRFIFAANHPLGGPDGVIFGSAIGQVFGNLRFLVNDLLMNIPNMEGFFIPVNKLGSNSRTYTQSVDDAYAADKTQVLLFPAGMVSRKQNGVIKDLEWSKSFIVKAKKHHRDVIPVFIGGKNSKFFYNLAWLRTKLGIKANLEMFFLVNEFYKHKNETIDIYLGKPISYKEFNKNKKPKEWAEFVKNITYSLPSKIN